MIYFCYLWWNKHDILCSAPKMFFFFFVEKWPSNFMYFRDKETFECTSERKRHLKVWFLLFCVEKRNYYIWRITLWSNFSFSQKPNGNMLLNVIFYLSLILCNSLFRAYWLPSGLELALNLFNLAFLRKANKIKISITEVN